MKKTIILFLIFAASLTGIALAQSTGGGVNTGSVSPGGTPATDTPNTSPGTYGNNTANSTY